MATCKGCGLESCFWVRQGGKGRLLEPGGKRHRCPSYRAEKPEYTGPATKPGPRITGKDYRPSCGACPPWEDCRHAASTEQAPTPAERANAEADARWIHFLDLIGQP